MTSRPLRRILAILFRLSSGRRMRGISLGMAAIRMLRASRHANFAEYVPLIC